MIAEDKKKHFWAGVLVAFFTFPYSMFVDKLVHGALITMAIVIGVGLGKEVSDYLNKGRFDWIDLLFTVMGGAVALIVAWLIPEILYSIL